jgi:predicted metal-binding membrane protein
MGSATVRRPGAVSSRRRRIAVLALLLLAAVAAWALSADRMDGMDSSPAADLGGLGWFAASWALMMAAMMLPSFAPAAAAYAGRASAAPAVIAFVAGYLAAWTGAGLVAYGLIEAVRSLDVGFLAWDEAGRYVAGSVIVAAALYELSPLKDACLRRCRDPLALVRRERPGSSGGLRAGLDHGAACIGCCWALMAALFALGVMSVGWMALVAALVAVEKLLPWREVAERGVALGLVLLGLAVAIVPGELPGFTSPGSGEMMMMEPMR